MEKHVLSAKGKKLGRVASEAAIILMGKNRATFRRNIAPEVSVEITEASLIDLSEKKRLGSFHAIYSGHPGGLKRETPAQVIEKKGYSELVTRAVSGMLPKNSLRKKMLQNLNVKK